MTVEQELAELRKLKALAQAWAKAYDGHQQGTISRASYLAIERKLRTQAAQ